jgi:ABC-2 type transport system ATP-binding protein
VNAIDTSRLGKRYGGRHALQECTLSIPTGRVVGLVGTNGAGKTTLLHLAVGLLEPSEGSIRVFDEPPGRTSEQLARVGFLAQNAPLYASLSVVEHLRLGARLNRHWDAAFAETRIARLGLALDARAGRLSGGQRAQLALTMAIAKRLDLLLLDEPVASLDPLARREFLSDLMQIATERGPTVVLSSHSIADVERVCDHLVVLADGRVRLAGDIDELLADHRVLTGPRRERVATVPGYEIVLASSTERQTTLLVRGSAPVLDPHWSVVPVGLEELVLAYLTDGSRSASSPSLTAVGG